MIIQNHTIDKFFIFLITILNISTPTYLEFSLFGLETSYEFLIYFIWIIYGLIISFFNNKVELSIYFFLSIFLIFFLFLIELFVKSNFKAFYEINFLILFFSIYKFQQVKDYYFLKKLILINFLIFIYLLFNTNVSFGGGQWDFRQIGDEYLKRKSLYGYVSISLSVMIAFTLLLILELFKKKVFNVYFLLFCSLIFSYYLILTYSRTGFLLVFLYIFYNFLFFKDKKSIIYLILSFISIFLFISNLNFNDYINIFSNLFENIRVGTWYSETINFFSNDFLKIIFGDVFFIKAIDNTFLSLLIGKGIVGFGLYIFFFKSLYTNLLVNKNPNQIKFIKIFFILLLVSFNFMEFFGQRKIIFLFSLYLSFIISLYDQKNNHS